MLCISVQYFREQLKLLICFSCISVHKYIEITFMFKLSSEFTGAVTFGLGKNTRALEYFLW